jgi:threonine synthase
MNATVMLGEGSTPLVRSICIGPALGVRNVFFKLENRNPSGSYKDRFVATEVTRILRIGARACVATSSGNTGSSLAAYCSRYGIACAIVVNDSTPIGKLEQMQAHGAHVFRVHGVIRSAQITTQVFDCLSKLALDHRVPLIISAYRYCPEGMAGVESMAHELQSKLMTGIDHVFVPVGGGGLYSAVCRGFERGSGCRPRVHAVQPNGCSTVVATFERGDNNIRAVESTTRISGWPCHSMLMRALRWNVFVGLEGPLSGLKTTRSSLPNA